ncbi:sulfotransferase family protein [Nevskia ramosa]|uniref:sulfotransferase family protein n=1 Tax=Nevskia ramosa TaxID=64002 RepID=UPI0003B3E1EB|nr:sulfotransferase [Nevskia ramosa]
MNRMPNTFLIGAPKSGTTALASWLAAHPQVCFSSRKEPGYFARDFPPHADIQAHFDPDRYRALFTPEPQHRVIAEGSTNYLLSADAVPAILALNPNARFIVSLRNPLELAPALHMQQCYMLNEDQADFADAWRLQVPRARGEQIPAGCRQPRFLQYAAFARTGEQIERLLRLVPRSSVHIIRFDALRADPGAVYRQTLAFLGLDDDGRNDFPVVNGAHRRRYPDLARLLLNPPALLRAPLWRLRKTLRSARLPLVEALRERQRQDMVREPLSPALRAELARHFADDIRLLERLLGWDLSDWLQAEPTRPSTSPRLIDQRIGA